VGAHGAAGTTLGAEVRARLDAALRGTVPVPHAVPSYVRDEILTAVIDELLVEVALLEPLR
jgi:hypothetical protein